MFKVSFEETTSNRAFSKTSELVITSQTRQTAQLLIPDMFWFLTGNFWFALLVLTNEKAAFAGGDGAAAALPHHILTTCSPVDPAETPAIAG